MIISRSKFISVTFSELRKIVSSYYKGGRLLEKKNCFAMDFTPPCHSMQAIRYDASVKWYGFCCMGYMVEKLTADRKMVGWLLASGIVLKVLAMHMGMVWEFGNPHRLPNKMHQGLVGFSLRWCGQHMIYCSCAIYGHGVGNQESTSVTLLDAQEQLDY